MADLGSNIFQANNAAPTPSTNPFQDAIAERGLGGQSQNVLRNQLAQRVSGASQNVMDQAKANYAQQQGAVRQGTRNLGRAVDIQSQDQQYAREQAQHMVDDYRNQKLQQLQAMRDSIARMRDMMAKHLDSAASDMQTGAQLGGAEQGIISGAQLATNIMDQSGFSFLNQPQQAGANQFSGAPAGGQSAGLSGSGYGGQAQDFYPSSQQNNYEGNLGRQSEYG